MNCVHSQEPHNLIKAGDRAICPWCHIDRIEARLRKAEGLIADALSSWDATGYSHFREQNFRITAYRQFLDKPGEP